ncbi:MAG: glutaredoxin domain-containing protein [bacterium]
MIKIYSTPVCPYCVVAKEFLKKNNISFEDINVAADENVAKEMIEKSHQMGVPVIDVDGEIFVGFNRAELENALKAKGLLS